MAPVVRDRAQTQLAAAPGANTLSAVEEAVSKRNNSRFSVSPTRVRKLAQAQMYEYLYGWEEYLRRTKERKASIITKKVPEGEMPFMPGRTRARPARFLKRDGLADEELDWRRLLGCGDPSRSPIENVSDLRDKLAFARKAQDNHLGGGLLD